MNQFLGQVAPIVRSAVLGNAGSLVAFSVGSVDAKILAPEFHPMEPGGLSDQASFTAWLRRSDGGRNRIDVEPKQFEALGSANAIKTQSRQRFGRFGAAIETRLYAPPRR